MDNTYKYELSSKDFVRIGRWQRRWLMLFFFILLALYLAVGVISAFTIILHNLPEGIITYLSSMTNIQLGISLTIAIALHNIPEGISIAVPIYSASKSRGRALFYTLLAALAEPIGAVLAFLFLKDIITNTNLGIILSLTAGIMLYISMFELLPNSLKYKNKTPIIFLIGIIFVFFSQFLIS